MANARRRTAERVALGRSTGDLRSGTGSDNPGSGESEPARASWSAAGLFLVRLVVVSPVLAVLLVVVFVTQGDLVSFVLATPIAAVYVQMWQRETLSGRAAQTVGVALHLVATVLVATTLLAAIATPEDGRIVHGMMRFALLAVALAGLGACLWLLGAKRRPEQSLQALVLLMAMGVGAVVVMVLPRDAQATTGERILARDLAPESGYVAVLAAGLFVLLSLPLAFAWRSQGLGSVKADWRKAVVAAGLATVLLVPTLVAVGGGWARRLHDRRIESDLTSLEVEQASERLEATAGPARPTEPAWETALPIAYESGDESGLAVSVEAVPDWDSVLVAERVPTSGETVRVVALSVTDGSELWRYERRESSDDVGGVVVDPEAGRVLLVMQQAAVVLRLDDGSVADEREISGGLSCGPVLDQGFPHPLDDRTPIALGAVGIARCGPESGGRRSLVALETATGAVVARAPAPEDPERSLCRYAATGSDAAQPFVVRWGTGDTCGQPTVFGFDRSGGAGRLEPYTIISSPDPMACTVVCDDSSVAVVGDSIVLTLVWDGHADSGERVPEEDVIVVSPEGELLWRARDRAAGRDGAVPADLAVGPFTEDGIMVRWAGAWHLLAVADGAELAQHPADARDDAAACGPGADAITDGQRMYLLCDGGQLVVRRLDDLSAEAPVDLFPQPLPEPPSRPALLSAAGPLVVAIPPGPDQPEWGIASLRAYDDVSSG